MDGFRRAVNAYGFMDLGSKGLDFTWCNQRSNRERIRLRLDRVMIKIEWKEQDRYVWVLHVIDSSSDHCALVLSNQRNIQGCGERIFHFEAAWIRHNKCKEIIQDTWKNHSGFHLASELAEGLRA